MKNLTQFVPRGVNGIHAAEFEFKEQVLDQMKKLFKKHQYRQVEPPIFEYYDLFTQIEGTMNKDDMIKLIDTDGKILVLRPDATIPIARMVAADYKNEPVQKFSYITNIFRMNDDLQNIQSREFTQAGIELFGKDGVKTDVEIICLAIETLKEIGVKDFTIDIGQANFFKKLIEQMNLQNEQFDEVQRLIEDKNFAELRCFVEALSISDKQKYALQSIPALYGEPEKVFAKARDVAINDEMKKEIKHVKKVYEQLAEKGCGRHVMIDLGIINHLNYYSGIVFHGYVAGYGQPVLLGGRYDKLTSRFGVDKKAIGFAVYVDHLIAAIEVQKEAD